jgi:hypothetical protein
MEQGRADPLDESLIANCSLPIELLIADLLI